MEWSLRDNAERSRFELARGDDIAGILEYSVHADELTLVHTEVDGSYKGHGLGAKLAGGALDSARSRGLTVIPECPYVRRYLRNHHEYADLIREPHRTTLGLA
jgi:predicted GNAT family acetyltransferase